MADRGAVFQIEIFSDIICPWCYIGTRLLWKAIAELSQNHRATEFRFKWRPYMIAPGVGEKGEAMRDFMQKRYGKALNRDKDLSEAALEAGVSLEGGLLSRQMWNSAAAHRLVQLAGEQQEQQGQPDLQTAMMEALFEAYFHREQNIAALACLQDLADKVGVSCEGLSTGSVAALAATYKEPAEARGVKGVPFFCISRQGYPGSFRFSGAQFPQTFVRAFQSLLVDRDQLVSAIRSRATPPRTTSTNSTPVSHEHQEPAPVRRGSAFALGEEAETTGVDDSTSRTRSRSPLSHTSGSSTTDCESEATGRRFKRQRPAEPSPRVAIKSPVDEAVERGDDVQAAAEALSNVRAHGRVRSHEASPRLPQLNPVAASGKQALLPWVLAATEGSSGGGGSGRALPPPPPLPHPFAHRILQAPPHAGGGEVVYYYGQMHTGHDAHVLAHALRELPRERPSSYSCAQPLPPALRQPPTLRSPLALFEERHRTPLPPPPQQQQQHRRRSPDAAAPHAALERGGGSGAEAGIYGGGAPAMGPVVYHTGGYDVALAHGHPVQQRHPRQASPCSVDGSSSSSGSGSSAQHHVRYSSSAHAAEPYAACRQLPQSPSVIGASPHSHGLPLHRAQPTSSM